MAVTITPERQRMQDMLLADDTSALQAYLTEQLTKATVKKYSESIAASQSGLINEAAKIMATSVHEKAKELEATGKLGDLSNEEFASEILSCTNTALASNASTQDYAEAITGCKNGFVDPTSEPYKMMLAQLGGTSIPAGINPMPGAQEQLAQQNAREAISSQVFGSLFTFHEALKQNPQMTAVLMTLTPSDVQNSEKGQELQLLLADKIKQEAQEKYGLDVDDNQARTASRIMLTEFTKWGSSYYPNLQKQILEKGPLQAGEVNELLAVLARNTRTELRKNAAALGDLGHNEAIDALVGAGDSRDSVGINVTNIGFMTLSNLGDPNVQALAERRARDSLAVTGELDDKAIYAGIGSLPAAIVSDNGVQLQISETTKNFLTDVARQAKENGYDEGWGGGLWRIWEAICAFVSCIFSGGGLSGAWKAATDVFDPEKIEYKNRAKFESGYVNAIANASATELGYTGDPALFDSYKHYLMTSSVQRIFESTAGVPHMEDVAVTGAGNVSARSVPPPARSIPPSSEYYPGISPAPNVQNQAGKATSDAWAAASHGDANPAPLYIQRNGNSPLLVTTISDAEANTGPYQFDPKNHTAIAKAAKEAAAAATKTGEVLIARDINNNGVIDTEKELFRIPKSEIASSKIPVEIVPGK